MEKTRNETKFIYFLIKIGFFYTILPTFGFIVSQIIFGEFEIGKTIGVFTIFAIIGYILSYKTWKKQEN